MSFVVRKDPSHQFPYPESGLYNVRDLISRIRSLTRNCRDSRVYRIQIGIRHKAEVVQCIAVILNRRGRICTIRRIILNFRKRGRHNRLTCNRLDLLSGYGVRYPQVRRIHRRVDQGQIGLRHAACAHKRVIGNRRRKSGRRRANDRKDHEVQTHIEGQALDNRLHVARRIRFIRVRRRDLSIHQSQIGLRNVRHTGSRIIGN